MSQRLTTSELSEKARQFAWEHTPSDIHRMFADAYDAMAGISARVDALAKAVEKYLEGMAEKE